MQELVKKNEDLERRLNDLKVTLKENKTMMQELMMENQAKEIAAAAAEKAAVKQASSSNLHDTINHN